ncbi:MAG: TonB-dependent siderophore receptor, partial [Methylococcales bacterium]
RFLTTHGNFNSTQVFASPRQDNQTFDRGVYFQDQPIEAYTTNLDLIGRFSLWNTHHEILLGTDYTLGIDGYHFIGSGLSGNSALAIDILNPGPNYGMPNPLFQNILAQRPNFFSVSKQEWWGVYFQDHIILWDKLHIVGGGRHDWADTGRGFGASFAEAESALEHSSPSIIRQDKAFSPRVGILYQAWPWLSVYGNWTTSFGANNGVSATLQRHPPESSEQYEAGFKTELFDRRLNATLGFYHISKQNILTSDRSTPDPFDTIAIGKVRSQGIEFDLAGQFSDGLYLIGSYAWTDTRVTKDNFGLEGNRLPNVPEHADSLFLKYDFENYAPLSGLSLGFGTYVATNRQPA